MSGTLVATMETFTCRTDASRWKSSWLMLASFSSCEYAFPSVVVNNGLSVAAVVRSIVVADGDLDSVFLLERAEEIGIIFEPFPVVMLNCTGKSIIWYRKLLKTFVGNLDFSSFQAILYSLISLSYNFPLDEKHHYSWNILCNQEWTNSKIC